MQKNKRKQLQIQKPEESDNFVAIPTSYGIVSRKSFMNQLQLDPKVKLPQIQNVVATVNLNTKLDLKHIALSARNTEYNPKRFSAVVIRLREPKTTALVFSTGKMVVTGAKNEYLSKLAARKFARIIQKLGFDVQFLNFKIQNIVSSCDVNFPIDLEHIANKYGEFCSYEPEVFPGLVYRMMDPKIVFLIFVSGKIVLTGAKLRQDIDFAFEKIYPVLQDAKKQKKNIVLKLQLNLFKLSSIYIKNFII